MIVLEELATVIIVTYNSRHYLNACLNSVLDQDYPHEVMIVDNCSVDGTVEYVRNAFPQVKVIECPENRGYGAGNNLGVRHAKGEYIVILNPDVIVEKGWLRELVTPLHDNPKKITTPKILVYDGSVINTCGNINNFTGLTFTRGLGEEPSRFDSVEAVSGISGACFALRRADYISLGGFDENFFLYNEDSDLSWRANLLKYSIHSIPTSIVRHDYQLKVSPEKIYYLETGRYLILRKYFSRRDLLLIAPSLLITEVLTFGYAMKFGTVGIQRKFSALIDGLFTIKADPMTGDKARMKACLCSSIPVDQLSSNKFEICGRKLVNKVFVWNYGVIQ